MAFKAESDDIRSSLSYKLKRILRYKTRLVLCHDPFVTNDPDLSPLGDVIDQSDLLLLATPHRDYDHIEAKVPVIDIWGRLGHGSGL
jgi:UDP-N-acetyl-D-mannosaminuronic acid dehydrogenase